jgi:hypothetical protein
MDAIWIISGLRGLGFGLLVLAQILTGKRNDERLSHLHWQLRFMDEVWRFRMKALEDAQKKTSE